jgi:hypothetical protein
MVCEAAWPYIYPDRVGEGMSFASVSKRLAVVRRVTWHLSQRRAETSEAPKTSGLLWS